MSGRFFRRVDLEAVYMGAGLARSARRPGKRNKLVECLYERVSSRLPDRNYLQRLQLVSRHNYLNTQRVYPAYQVVSLTVKCSLIFECSLINLV